MSNLQTKKRIIAGMAGLALLCLSASQVFAAETLGGVPLGDSTIRIGLSPYADELATTALADQMLKKLGYKVTNEHVDVGVWFAGVAGGSMDVGFNAWLPITHGAYWKRYESKLLDLGTVYQPTKLGWAVPNYVPKKMLDSISDLKNPAVIKKLDGKVTGISAGSGEMQLSSQAMKAYSLSKAGLRLQTSSGPVMTAALARALQRHQWIVMTAWTPHWIWARFNIRYLKDPKGLLGKGGRVDVIAGKDFPKRFPRATAFIKQFRVPVTGIEEIMNNADKLLDKSSNDTGEAYTQAANDYIKTHPDLVKKWLQPANESAAVKQSQAAG